MIDQKNFFDQTLKKRKRTYGNIRKLVTGEGDDSITCCILDYVYFKNYYKMAAINLSKQQALDTDPKAIQQINFTSNIDRARQTTMYFIAEKAKEIVLDFSQGTVIVFHFFLLL